MDSLADFLSQTFSRLGTESFGGPTFIVLPQFSTAKGHVVIES